MYSEDPMLTARIAVEFITGLQDAGVGACVKHFVANEQEEDRFTYESQVDERSLRELYLRPFEAAVKEAGVRAVMASYNFVNGDHACSHEQLLQHILKKEWGFNGIVVSDWGALKELEGPARNGCDLEMPGPGRWWGGGQLERAVTSGLVDEKAVDDKVRRILGFLQWRGRLPGVTDASEERSIERDEHRRLARRVATDSMVLLKNDGLLPLRPGPSVALIGPGAAKTSLLGGGSATVLPHRRRSLLDAFRERWPGELLYAEGVSLERGGDVLPRSWIDGGVAKAELFDGVGCDGEPFAIQNVPTLRNLWFGDTYPADVDKLSVRLTVSITPHVSGPQTLVGAGAGPTRLYVDGDLVADNQVDGFVAGLAYTAGAGRVTLEAGRSYELVLEQLPMPDVALQVATTHIGIAPRASEQESALAEAERIAAAADIAIVIVGSDDQWESEGADRESLSLPAGQDALVERVLAVNPRTAVLLNCGAPMLMPWLDAVPAALITWYPGQEGADAIVDVLLGLADPGGRMPTTWPRDERDAPSYRSYRKEDRLVRYDEQLLIGHRWYDAKGIAPLVPFGHGLSYASFDWGPPTVTQADGPEMTVDVPIRNTSDRSGWEVVQVYVAPRADTLARPTKVLAGFEKVQIDAGDRATARVSIGPPAFSYWDTGSRSFRVAPGSYDLVIAASACDERYRIDVHVQSG
jgi:beta-glucosidase